MQQFRRILVGVDLTSTGNAATPSAATLVSSTLEAVRRAVWLAGQISAEVTFLAAEDISAFEQELLDERFKPDTETVEERAYSVLNELVENAQADGVQASAKLSFGPAWKMLIREAVENRHDLVTVGTRNLGRASRLLLGSTGMKLMRNCPVPVWVTRPDPNWDDFNILVASDFSEVSQRALDIAVGGAQLADAKVRLLHVMEGHLGWRMWLTGLPESSVHEFRERKKQEAEEQLHEQLAQTDYRTLSHGVQVDVVEGAPDVAILDAIEEHEIDLLVMGTLARAGVPGLLIGNTAERLLAQVPCSVLAVKPDGFECPVPLTEK